MKMKMLLFLTSALLFSCGCTFNAWNKDFVTPAVKLHPPQLQLLNLGITKQEVIAALGNPDQVVGAKKDGDNTIETWEYFRVEAVPGPDRIAERYQVVFTNGKLSSYESVGDLKQQINVR
jgi:hypothetical protein